MENIKLKNLFVCENVIIANDGKFSVINIFDDIKSTGFPAIHPKLTIATIMMLGKGSYNEQIEIVSPNETVIAKVENKVDVTEPNKSSGFLANFINTVFTVEGKYWIRVSIDGKPITFKDEYFISVQKNNK